LAELRPRALKGSPLVTALQQLRGVLAAIKPREVRSSGEKQ
jgi:hypothetical protein